VTVRSTQLGVYHSTAPVTPSLFTCPTGWRTIVKSAYIDNQNADSLHYTLIFGSQKAGVGITLVTGVLNTNTQAGWNGWLVMDPGDTLSAYLQDSSMAIVVSGTLLLLTGQEAP
jgi:hypothetical protein